MQNQMQPPMSPQMPAPFMRRRQAPGTVLDLETGLPPARLPEITENIGLGAMAPDKFMQGMRLPEYFRYKEGEPVEPQRNLLRRPRRLPQIMPERMPSRRPTPRFFGGGLGSIFARLPRQRVRERMSPPLPRAPLPIPQDMLRDPFMFMRPRFAEGEGVDINRIIADQGAREGISPSEMATQRIKQFLADSGRTVSNRDAELFGMGMLTLEDIMQRAEPVTNRNLMQQEQMFFPESESLDQILEDLEKKN